jgi:serine phosphatase RsbU (regulator of sigma subunit)
MYMPQSAVIDSLRVALAAKQATVDALMEAFRAEDFPVVDGLTFDVLYKPAATVERLGGDWYDIFLLPDGRVAFTLGDVCGRGLAAAVKMSQARQAIKVAASLAVEGSMPIAVLEQANKVIFLNGHHVQFTTAIYGVIDTARHTITYACAGHHPPILAKMGREPVVLPNHGFALGVEVEMPDLIREHQFVYESGMLFVLYTDGLIELNHDIDEGQASLLIAARNAVESLASKPAQFIVESVVTEEQTHPDDIAVLTIAFA